MMSMKKILSATLTAVLMVSVFAGCSNSNSTPNQSEGKNEQSSASNQEKVEIRFSWWGNDARHEATLKAIDMYMEKNPNVKIEAEYRGKSERELIATQLAGGTVADVVQLNAPWMADMTANGDFFVDLESKKELLDMSGFDEKFVKDYGVYNGKLIALPAGINARVTLLNNTVASEYGIPTGLDVKWTWDDLYNTGKKINQQNKERYFLNADTRTLGNFVLRPYIMQLTGEQFIKDDYTIGFTKENLVEAFKYIDQLYKDKIVQPVEEANVFMDVTSTNPKWINGDIAAEFMWTSQMTGASKDIKGETSAFIMPMHPNAKDTALYVQPSQLMAVSNKSKNIDEAVKFLNFFFNDIEAGKVLKDHRSIPSVKKVREVCIHENLLDKKVIEGVDYGLANIGDAVNAPSTNAEIEKIITDGVEMVAYSERPIDKVADNTISLIQDVLKSLKSK